MTTPQESRAATSVAPMHVRAIVGLLGALVLAPIVIATALAFAWRWTQPSALLPTLLVLELAAIVALLTIGRHARKRIVARLHGQLQQRVRNPAARLGIPLALLLVALLGSKRAIHHELPRSSVPAEQKSVAVVGAGAAGLHAAWMLHQAGIDYTVYEADDRIAGHAHAAPFTTASGETVMIDMGFIFGAPKGYEEMKVMMARYGVERVHKTVSYSTTINGTLWATDAIETLDPEALRFHQLVEAAGDDKSLTLVPFGWWLKLHGFDDEFRHRYLTPILTILLITSDGIYECSTRLIFATFNGVTKWVDFRESAKGWVVGGSSAAYYARMSEPLLPNIHLSTPVTSVERMPDGKVELRAIGPDGQAIVELYDDVILAVPADVARVLLVDRTRFEDWMLGQVRYKDAKVVLHTDSSVLPADESMRRSYNWLEQPEWNGGFELHGRMTGILEDGLVLDPEPIGTFNPQRPLQDVRFERVWRHHVLDIWHLALATQLMPKLQGNGGIHYAGDWVNLIGHGQAIRTGIQAACRAGATISKPIDPDADCVDAIIQDPMPELGIASETRRICGDAGAYQYALERACALQP